MNTTKIKGELEIDHNRGVIYFHCSEGEMAGGSVLRICRLPKPIPANQFIDITHMVDVNYHRVEQAYYYFVDFFDAFDGWCGIKEYKFTKLDKACEFCVEKNKELHGDNKRMGEHWSVIDKQTGMPV